MKKELFNQVVKAIEVYHGIELLVVIEATKIFIFKIKSTFKN